MIAFTAALALFALGLFALARLGGWPELHRQPLSWLIPSWLVALLLLIATSVAGLRRPAERDSTQWQQAILNSTEQIMMGWAGEGTLRIFNPAAEKAFGYTRQEALGRLKAEDLLVEGDWRKVFDLAAKPSVEEFELDFRRQDGSSFPALVRGTVLRSNAGAAGGFLAVVSDLTAVRRTRQASRESEDLYREIFENSRDMIATISPQGRYLYVNPAWQAHFGQTAESFADLIGFESAFPPEVQAEAGALFRRALSGVPIERAPLKLRGAEGASVEVEAALSCVRADDRVLSVRCVLRDVTPRNRRERRLALQLKVSQIVGESTTQEQALPRVLDSLGASLGWECAFLWMVDEDQKQIRFRHDWISPGRVCADFRRETAASVFSRSQGLPGIVWAHGSPVWMEDLAEDPGFCRRETARMEGLASGWGVPVRVGNQVIGVIEFFSRRRQREDREVMATVETVCASVGQFMARSAQERRVHELSRQKESILNSVADGILGADAEGKVVFANPAAARMLALSGAGLAARTMHAIVHEGRPGLHAEMCVGQCDILRAFSSLEASNGQDIFYRSDGTSFPVEFSVTPMVEYGLAAGSVISFRDVSQREALDRMKDEFISNVSHELRTPLTSIRGALGLLSGGLLSEKSDKAANLLRIAVSNSDRLIRLINDILDLERLQSGRAPFAIRACVLDGLVREAIDSMNPVAETARIRMMVESGRVEIEADSDRMLQVLTNLLSNAIKFSPPESVVKVAIARTAEGVVLQVIDSGRGIPADKLESIFARFQQVDVSDQRQRGGTGLGLAICRTIVHQHGGRIWAQQNPAGGSVFSVFLPSQQAAPQQEPQRIGDSSDDIYRDAAEPKTQLKVRDVRESPQ